MAGIFTWAKFIKQVKMKRVLKIIFFMALLLKLFY